MDIKQLESAGGFVSDDLVPKKGIWKKVGDDGEVEDLEISFFVRQATYAEYKRGTKNSDGLSYDPDALLVAACIRLGADGSQTLSYEQAYRLNPALFTVFLTAIGEVYGGAPKPSRRKTNSGANSSSMALEEKPLPKRKTPSHSKRPSSGKRTSKSAAL